MRCPICGSRLARVGRVYRCPLDGMYFRGERGAPEPSLGMAKPGGEEKEGVEDLVERHGVKFTPEGLEYIKRHGKGILRLFERR